MEKRSATVKKFNSYRLQSLGHFILKSAVYRESFFMEHKVRKGKGNEV